MTATATESSAISNRALLDHWQGHRRLTRRVIEAFPEEKLFTFSIGGMRPFSEMVLEFLKVAGPSIRGIATGEWKEFDPTIKPASKAELLGLWDDTTETINSIWPQISRERFLEEDTAFGKWKNTCYSMVLYAIDNEVHHRGQGYVYLRALGIEPPPFWERS